MSALSSCRALVSTGSADRLLKPDFASLGGASGDEWLGAGAARASTG